MSFVFTHTYLDVMSESRKWNETKSILFIVGWCSKELRTQDANDFCVYVHDCVDSGFCGPEDCPKCVFNHCDLWMWL